MVGGRDTDTKSCCQKCRSGHAPEHSPPTESLLNSDRLARKRTDCCWHAARMRRSFLLTL